MQKKSVPTTLNGRSLFFHLSFKLMLGALNTIKLALNKAENKIVTV